MKRRLQVVTLLYIISLMVETRKHSLKFASGLSGTDSPRFSKFLRNNNKIAWYTLENLSKKEAKRYSAVLKKSRSLPWNFFLLVDNTFQKRSSLKSENVQKFNHGKGFVIGHQWTNILLIFNGIIIPLTPFPFYTKEYCRRNRMTYETEHERLIGYINALNLKEYIGYHRDREVVVLTDSGYDDKDIQNVILKKGWHFISALKISRGVKTEAKYAETRESSGWDGTDAFFRNHREIGWKTVRIFTDGPRKKRKEFRVRHADVFLKGVKKIRAVCSEFKRKRDGRRKFIACSDLKATTRQILIAYRLRWKIEIFHKNIKMFFGFEDVASKHFTSVGSHVYLAYCAYIMLNAGLPGIGEVGTISEKQQKVAMILENRKTASVIHELTKIGGTGRYKDELKSALAA
jgi:hypothetical protein